MLDRDNVLRLAGGSYDAQFVGGPTAAALSRAGAFTLEACITPEHPADKGTGTIISLAPVRGGSSARLALVQTRRRLGLMLAAGDARAPSFAKASEGLRQAVPLCEVETGTMQHVAVTCRHGSLTCYLDGRRAAQARMIGTFTAHGPYRLVLGDTYAGDSDWSGRLEGVAIYARSLRAEEVRRNYRARLALVRRRPQVPVLKVRATLLEQSDPPRPGPNPYYRALAICRYRVDKVIEGRYERPEILVAHWARWRNALLPFCKAPPGRTLEMTLEPFDRAGPRVTRAAMSFTLGDETFDLPWYYDAGLLSLTFKAGRPAARP